MNPRTLLRVRGEASGAAGSERSLASTRLLAVVLAVALVSVGCSVFGGDDEATPWFEPLIPNGPVALAELCAAVCTADLVVLPELIVVDSVVDLPMPETAGALSIERVWTGERGRLFGRGWETVWDIRLSDGTMTGPLPAVPLAKPERGAEVELVDGTAIEFDDQGRPVRICPDSALCTSAEWTDGELRLSVGTSAVELALDDNRATTATSSDGRTVSFTYVEERLAQLRSGAGDLNYSYEDGRLARIDGADRRAFEYVDGAVRAMVDREGRRWSFSPLGLDRLQVTDPDGEAITYTFAARDLIEATGADGGVLLRRSYEGGDLVAEVRPRDGITMTRLAPNQFEVKQERALEPSRRSVFTVDQLGRVVQNVSSDGETVIAYEGRSTRPTSTTTGDAVTAFEYDAAGLLLGTSDADGYRVTLDRDDLGRVRSITDGVLATHFDYDPAGRPIVEESAGRTTRAEFDPEGRVQSLILPDGADLPVHYDAAGSLQSIGANADESALSEVGDAPAGSSAPVDTVDEIVESSEGLEYRYSSGRTARYDNWGRLTELQSDGRSTAREYDEDGRLTELILPDGRTYSLAYSNARRIESVSDGTVTADLAWHGDLLISVTTSGGTSYRYGYDASGRLISSEVGPAKWSYRYDASGNLSEVSAPTGSLSYEWDAHGRPERAVVDGRALTYGWLGDGFDLEAVTELNREVVRFERGNGGQVTSMETADGGADFEYLNGAVVGYELADGLGVSLTYGPNGEIASVAYGDTTEQWDWSESELRAVTIDDARYELDWLAPGILSSVSRDGDVEMRIDVDPLGRAESVRGGDGEVVGTFGWSSAGLMRAVLDDWSLELDYDAESRPVRVDADGSTLTSDYAVGVLAALTVGDTDIADTYADGRVASSRVEQGDRWVDITWAGDGQPASFVSSEGSGSFDYRGGRVATILYDDRVREVTYNDDGRPSADATGGDFLDDLFGARGTFTTSTGEHLTEPWAPWFDALPQELGLELPGVVTGDDIVSAAIEQAVPDIPMPIVPTDDVAERTALAILTLAAPASLPVASDRVGALTAQPGEIDFDGLLAASPMAVVGGSVLDNLADGPCLLCRVVDAGVGAVTQVGRAGAAAVGFVTDSFVGRAVISVAFFVATFAVGALCSASGMCAVAFGIAAPVAVALLTSGGDDLPSAVAAAVFEPLRVLPSGRLELEPAALLSIALTVAAYRAGASSSPRLATLRARAVAPVCNATRVVCVSTHRFGPAAGHVADAQRNGAPRLLRIDRAGAQARRTSALRSVPTLAGFDRDEYPFAVSSLRNGLSIRYIDPTSNRSLGSYLGRQLSPLPDGARFYVLPIA